MACHYHHGKNTGQYWRCIAPVKVLFSSDSIMNARPSLMRYRTIGLLAREVEEIPKGEREFPRVGYVDRAEQARTSRNCHAPGETFGDRGGLQVALRRCNANAPLRARKLKKHWRGLTGGDEVWREIAAFFSILRQEAICVGASRA